MATKAMDDSDIAIVYNTVLNSVGVVCLRLRPRSQGLAPTAQESADERAANNFSSQFVYCLQWSRIFEELLVVVCLGTWTLSE